MTNVKRNTRDEAEATPPTLMVIGGGARESVNGTFIDVENPANHTVVCNAPSLDHRRRQPRQREGSAIARAMRPGPGASLFSPLLGSQGQDWLHA